MGSMKAFNYFFFVSFLISCGGGNENSPDINTEPSAAALDFSFSLPTILEDYASFSVTITPLNLQQNETVELSLDQLGNDLLFAKIDNLTLTARAPFTYSETQATFTLRLKSSLNREKAKSLSIPIRFNHVADKFNTLDGLLNFNPSNQIQLALQNEN